MRQYQEAKNAYPDALLLFRLGDFYELFGDDAVVAARELGITLTSRNKGAPGEVPMAGVPHHAAHEYIAKLIARGHQVALCDQLGDPSKIKGLVPRKVVRVVTPGLMTDTAHLDARENNYLLAIDRAEPRPELGLALLDLSTGELSAAALSGPAMLLAEVARAEPREILLDPGAGELRAALALSSPQAFLRDDEPLEDAELDAHLDQGTAVPLSADARRDHPHAAVRAAARALRFARHTLPETSIPVRRITRYDPHSTLHIDQTAQRHLELVRGAEGTRRGSLLEVLDATVTPGGARLLKRQLLAPLTDVSAIRRRLDAVELFVAHPAARQELREALGRVDDLERLAIRVSLGDATPRDLAAMRESLAAAPDAHRAITSIPAGLDGRADAEEPGSAAAEGALAALRIEVDLLPELAALLARALVDTPPAHVRDGGVVRAGYDADLDELAEIRQRGTEMLVALEARLREQTGIPSLKVKYTRVFGWYIEVTRTHLAKVPPEWRRKQTLATAERYATDELDGLADKVLHAEERHAEREAALFAELVERAASQADPLRKLAQALARWDTSSALAETAHRNDYGRPEVDEGDGIALGEARHPVVERYVEAGRFVPNDTALDLGGERLLLITGPNMAGKSTLMRQVALCTILAQMGSYVPARQAHIGVVDRVLCRVGASDNLARGESTFMVEMRETAAILREATARSLVIVDEIGRGTSTFDGMAIAWAVAEYLHDQVRCRALFATHYHELTELAERFEGIANYSVSAREHDGDIVFIHRLTPGSVSRSYGVAVARLAGLPEAVLGRAGAILASLEAEAGRGPRARDPEPQRRAEAQLELFRPAEARAEDDVMQTLRHLDVNRMTPLEALELLAKLKQMGSPD